MEQSRWINLLALLTLAVHWRGSGADINSGCPFWGCLPSGSFSLSSRLPSGAAQVRWRIPLEQLPANSSEIGEANGCVTSQSAVVCTTQRGYVSLNPRDGRVMWNYTTKSPPHLPVLDIYGDIIGSDSESMYFVNSEGNPKPPIDVTPLNLQHSIMVANNSLMFLASSQDKGNHVVTFTTDGLIDAGIRLDGTVSGVNGSFIPCSQPIVAGFRAYVMTRFKPDDRHLNLKNHKRVSGASRLYAIDAPGAISARIKIAWYLDLDHIITYPKTHHTKFSKIETEINKKSAPNSYSEPSLAYLDGKVYVNAPTGSCGFKLKDADTSQPLPGRLWAIQDGGNKGSILFNTTSMRSPLAVYETYIAPGSGHTRVADKDQVIWLMNRSPAILRAVNSTTGRNVPVKGLGAIFESIGGWISSKLAVARSTQSPNSDQIVFGMADSTGQPRLVAIEVDLDTFNATLLFLRNLNEKGFEVPDKVPYFSTVQGQIGNFAISPHSHTMGDFQGNWVFGLAAVVSEVNKTTISRSVVGVY